MTSSSISSQPQGVSSPGDDAVTGADEPNVDLTELDLSGEVCPFTFVRTKLALEALPIGARLRVIVDHEPAVRNVPRSAKEWGQEVVGSQEVVGEETQNRRWAIDLVKRVR